MVPKQRKTYSDFHTKKGAFVAPASFLMQVLCLHLCHFLCLLVGKCVQKVG